LGIHNFVLSYYKNAVDGIHVQKICNSVEAQKPHTHAYFQIYYVARGSITHYVGEASSELSRGDMFIIPPGNLHRIKIGEDMLIYSFSFMPDTFGEPDVCNRLVTNFLRNMETADVHEIHPKITVPSDEVLHIENVLEQMLKAFNQKPLGYGEVIRAYGIILLALFVRVYYETRPEQFALDAQNNRQAVLMGIAYVDQNYMEQITLTEIAHQCAISKSSFSNLFASITGMSFHQYLNTRRIDYAIQLIRKGYQVTRIYGLCGYNDFSTFYRNFRKITGVSPEQYRKINMKKKDTERS